MARGKKDKAPDGASVQSTRRPARKPPVPPGWSPRVTDASQISGLLAKLPTQPGVYIMRDRKGHVIYVGKAASLRTRVRQYFTGHDTRAFVPLLTTLVGDIETVVVANAKEALLLENNLIKEHRPRFNVKLRDDSNYLVLKLDPKTEWPRLVLVRAMKRDAAQYFGPYHSASSARATLRVVNRHFKLRTCTDYVLHHRRRPCLQYQIDRCPAPCVYEVDEQQYADQVKDVGLFLSGRHRELVDGLKRRMKGAADGLDFETAARLRDQLRAVETTLTSQQVVGNAALDQDVVGMYREGGQVEFVVLHVRRGKLLGNESFSAKGMELPDAEVLADFVSELYQSAALLPDEVLLPTKIADDDREPLEAYMRERKGKKVVLAVPERGDRKKLIKLAANNAKANFVARRNRREDADAALERLRKRLGLSKMPRTIECYDVSHIQGSDTVASMVVFVDGQAEKSRYRSFKIKGTGLAASEGGLAQGSWQNDDFTSMYEVLGRRFRRALEGSEDWALPDLIVIDGGKGQLSRVITAVRDLGVDLGAEGVDVVALAKERHGALGYGRKALERLEAERGKSATPGEALQGHVIDEARADDEGNRVRTEVKPERVFVPDVKDPIVLRQGSSERYLMERVRDEAHRFAIRHHRKRRSKRAIRSSLDDIPGVGPSLKRELVKHFGSVSAIKTADEEALVAVKGVGKALAHKIATHFGGRA